MKTLNECQDVFNVAEANLDLAHEAYFTAKTDGAPKEVLAPLLAVLEQARFVYRSAEFMLGQAS